MSCRRNFRWISECLEKKLFCRCLELDLFVVFMQIGGESSASDSFVSFIEHELKF